MQASASQSFDLGGIGASRRQAARAERAEMSAIHRRDALLARIDAAESWIELWALQVQHRQIDEERLLAFQLAERVQRAVQLGTAVQPDATEAMLFAENLARATLDAQGLVYEQALMLARALGLDGSKLPTALGRPPTLELPKQTTWNSYIGRADTLPASQSAQLRAKAAQARLQEARVQDSIRLTPTVTAQWGRPQDFSVFVGLGVQLPIFAQNARARGQALALATQAQQGIVQAAVQGRLTLRLALHKVAQTRKIEDQVRQRILPGAQAWVAQTTRRFEAGETDVFSVLRARGRLIEARHVQLGAEKQRRWAEVKAWLFLACLPATKVNE